MATTARNASADEGAFSLATWMGKGSRPARYVTLYAANDVQAEIDDIDRELADMERRAGGSWAGASGTDKLEKRREELQKQIADTAAVFKVRAMSPDDNDAIARKYPFGEDDDAEKVALVMFKRWEEQVAAQVVAFGPSKDELQPFTMTTAQVAELRGVLGDVEWMKLVEKCRECMNEVSASSPFWRNNSGTSRS